MFTIPTKRMRTLTTHRTSNRKSRSGNRKWRTRPETDPGCRSGMSWTCSRSSSSPSAEAEDRSRACLRARFLCPTRCDWEIYTFQVDFTVFCDFAKTQSAIARVNKPAASPPGSNFWGKFSVEMESKQTLSKWFIFSRPIFNFFLILQIPKEEATDNCRLGRAY